MSGSVIGWMRDALIRVVFRLDDLAAARGVIRVFEPEEA
jgi:hypothetical protein